MCDCIIINQYIKIMDNYIYVGNEKLCCIPYELRTLLIKGSPKITINSVRILINEWEYKNGKFNKTLRGYIHKWF